MNTTQDEADEVLGTALEQLSEARAQECTRETVAATLAGFCYKAAAV